MKAVEEAARIAAVEATSLGIHWNNSPMIDVSRDPRWGRCTEGVGEDSYLGAELAKAQIRGYQSDADGSEHYIMACAKHYIAYGASDGGRDYNTVNISERELFEVYLPPFEAAVKEGVDSVMPAFTTYSNTPATANKYLLKKVLREGMNFEGLLISDYTAIAELVAHGAAKDSLEAAQLAVEAGLDVEMVSDCILSNGEILIKEKLLSEDTIDEAVKRILRAKVKLGLFDNPYYYINPEKYEQVRLSKKHREVVRDLARKSIVLLKNDCVNNGNILPLRKDLKSIAIIGPFADEKRIDGAWAFVDDYDSIVTLKEGIKNCIGDECTIYAAKGCSADGMDFKTEEESIRKAVRTAKDAEVIVLALGEPSERSGEARSYANIRLTEAQQQLTEEILALGKPTVMVVFNGRPIILDWYHNNVPAILETWFLGTEGGNAIAEVLLGTGILLVESPCHFRTAKGRYRYTIENLEQDVQKKKDPRISIALDMRMYQMNHCIVLGMV